ncbi:hypothetical protein [Nostocoides sp. Soil756]|jgi:hypothetical protein|uniref:hypothetical protein n=1 Tax=Nostocoides sp. Soil756 TaxID=1736399 RepID=UPI0007003CEA|nr:hypothetical protein [Tetrasphaera sp. Soil756]KRE60996.1 hypothetical protein ASG78_11585 [Tetrasphaera sp. Soil756]
MSADPGSVPEAGGSSLTVYGDVTDPLGRIASLRADALRAAGIPLEWRSVVQHVSTRVTAAPATAETRQHVAEVERWHQDRALPGERVAWPTPHSVPCPRPPVAGHAEAVGAGVGDHVRRVLVDAYWGDGLDIGNPDVLRHLLVLPILHGNPRADVLQQDGYAVAINGDPITTDAWRRIRHWRQEWELLGSPALPVAVDGDRVHSGAEAVTHLGSLIEERRLPFPTVNPFPLPAMPLPAQRLSVGRPGRRPAWWDA